MSMKCFKFIASVFFFFVFIYSLHLISFVFGGQSVHHQTHGLALAGNLHSYDTSVSALNQ